MWTCGEGFGESVFSDIAENYFHAALNDKYEQRIGLQNQKHRKIGEKKTTTKSFTVQNVF